MSQTVRKPRRTLKLKINASAPEASATSDQAGTAGINNSDGSGDEAPPAPGSGSSEIARQLWTEADEAAYQALAARRKAAGYRRLGRSDGSQLIAVGDITPGPNTIIATIVDLVEAKGATSRVELVAAMGSATFLHRKARPQDQGWCQGYIAESSSTPAA
jgi:hypothetical protein